jgi:hypothetical protein
MVPTAPVSSVSLVVHTDEHVFVELLYVGFVYEEVVTMAHGFELHDEVEVPCSAFVFVPSVGIRQHFDNAEPFA